MKVKDRSKLLMEFRKALDDACVSSNIDLIHLLSTEITHDQVREENRGNMYAIRYIGECLCIQHRYWDRDAGKFVTDGERYLEFDLDKVWWIMPDKVAQTFIYHWSWEYENYSKTALFMRLASEITEWCMRLEKAA